MLASRFQLYELKARGHLALRRKFDVSKNYRHRIHPDLLRGRNIAFDIALEAGVLGGKFFSLLRHWQVQLDMDTCNSDEWVRERGSDRDRRVEHPRRIARPF